MLGYSYIQQLTIMDRIMKKLTALSLTLFSLSLAPAAFGQSLCHSYYNDTKRLSDNLASLDPNSPVVKSNIPKLYDSAMGCTQNCSGAEFTFCAGIAERIAKDDPTGMNRSHMSESQKRALAEIRAAGESANKWAPDPTRQWTPYIERMQTANHNNIPTQWGVGVDNLQASLYEIAASFNNEDSLSWRRLMSDAEVKRANANAAYYMPDSFFDATITRIAHALPFILFYGSIPLGIFALYSYSTKRKPKTNSSKSPS